MLKYIGYLFFCYFFGICNVNLLYANDAINNLKIKNIIAKHTTCLNSVGDANRIDWPENMKDYSDKFNTNSDKQLWLNLTNDEWNCEFSNRYYIHDNLDLQVHLGVSCFFSAGLSPNCHAVIHNCLKNINTRKDKCYNLLYELITLNDLIKSKENFKKATNKIDEFKGKYCGTNNSQHIKFNYERILQLLKNNSYTTVNEIQNGITNIDKILDELNYLKNTIPTYLSLITTNDNTFINDCTLKEVNYITDVDEMILTFQSKKKMLEELKQKDIEDAKINYNDQINSFFLSLLYDGVINNKTTLNNFMDQYKIAVPAKEKIYLLEKQKYCIADIKQQASNSNIVDLCKIDINKTNDFCGFLTQFNTGNYCDEKNKILTAMCDSEKLFRINLKEYCNYNSNITNTLCQNNFQKELADICSFNDYTSGNNACITNSNNKIIQKCNTDTSEFCKMVVKINTSNSEFCEDERVVSLFCSEKLYVKTDNAEDYKTSVNTIKNNYCYYIENILCGESENEYGVKDEINKALCKRYQDKSIILCDGNKVISGYDFCADSKNENHDFCTTIKESKGNYNFCSENSNNIFCKDKTVKDNNKVAKNFCINNETNAICSQITNSYCSNNLKLEKEEERNPYCNQANKEEFKQNYAKLIELYDKKISDSTIELFKTTKSKVLININNLIQTLLKDYDLFLKASINSNNITNIFQNNSDCSYEEIIRPELELFEKLNNIFLKELEKITIIDANEKTKFNQIAKNVLEGSIIDSMSINENVIKNILLNYNIFDLKDYIKNKLNDKNIFSKDVIKIKEQNNLLTKNTSLCYDGNFVYREKFSRSSLKAKVNLTSTLISNILLFPIENFSEIIIGDPNIHLQELLKAKLKLHKAIIYLSDKVINERSVLKSICQNQSNDNLNIDNTINKIMRSNIYQYTQNKTILDNFFIKEDLYTKQLAKEPLTVKNLLEFKKNIDTEVDDEVVAIEKKIAEYSTISQYLYDLSYLIYLEGSNSSDGINSGEAPTINKFLVNELSKNFLFPNPFSAMVRNSKNFSRNISINAIENYTTDKNSTVLICADVLKQKFFCVIKNSVYSRYATPQEKFNNLMLLLGNDNLDAFIKSYPRCNQYLTDIKEVVEEDIEQYKNINLEEVSVAINKNSIYTDCSKYDSILDNAFKYDDTIVNAEGDYTFKKIDISSMSQIVNLKNYINNEENYFNNYGVSSFLDLAIAIQRLNQYETTCQGKEAIDKAKYQTMLNELGLLRGYIDRAINYHHANNALHAILKHMKIKETKLLSDCQKAYSKTVSGVNAKYNGFAQSACFLLKLISGPLGKTLATLYIIFVGFSLLNGKIEFGQLMSLVVAFGLTFGATSIAHLMSGNDYSCDLVYNGTDEEVPEDDMVADPVECDEGYVYSIKYSGCIKNLCKNPELPNVIFINPIFQGDGSNEIMLEENGEPIIGVCKEGYIIKNRSENEETTIKASCMTGYKWRYEGECEEIICKVDQNLIEKRTEVDTYMTQIDKNIPNFETILRKRLYAQNWNTISLKFNSIIQADCLKGYYNLGIKKPYVLAECILKDKVPTWSIVGTCTPSICPAISGNDAGTFTNAYANWPQTQFTENNIVEGECIAGYYTGTEIKPTRICQQDSTWGEVANSCFQIKCPKYILNDTTLFDEIIPHFENNTYIEEVKTSDSFCPKGYKTNEINEKPTAICQKDGIWKDILGCHEICKPLDLTPYNADLTTENKEISILPNEKLTLACKEGFNSTGDNTGTKTIQITCAEDKNWSTDGCKLVDCGVPTKKSNGITNTDWTITNGTTYSKQANITCATGYNSTGLAVGSKTITNTCQSNGNWSDTESCKVINCKNPSYTNTNFTQTSLAFGANPINGNCTNGYSGLITANCKSDGSWSYSGKCYKNCINQNYNSSIKICTNSGDNDCYYDYNPKGTCNLEGNTGSCNVKGTISLNHNTSTTRSYACYFKFFAGAAGGGGDNSCKDTTNDVSYKITCNDGALIISKP